MALGEVMLAEFAAPDARTLAMLQLVRGRTLAWWGFPNEALAEYRAARASAPRSARAMEAEAACLAGLRGDGHTVSGRMTQAVEEFGE
jgi:hypothetical protein